MEKVTIRQAIATVKAMGRTVETITGNKVYDGHKVSAVFVQCTINELKEYVINSGICNLSVLSKLKKADWVRAATETFLIKDGHKKVVPIQTPEFQEAERDFQILEDAYEHHRLVDFGGNFLDIRYVELEDIEKARELVNQLRKCA